MSGRFISRKICNRYVISMLEEYDHLRDAEIREEFLSTFNRRIEQQMYSELRREYEFPRAVCRSLTSMFKHYVDLYMGGIRGEGEIVFQAVSTEVPPGVPVEEMFLKPVKLTVYSPNDAIVCSRDGQRGLLQHRIVRITNQALDQGTLLTQGDLSLILAESRRTISRHIKQIEGSEESVPTRGKWKDIGPGESHKKKIVELYLLDYEYTDIARRTRHSPEAIMRYVKAFARVLTLSEEGYSDNEIRMISGTSIKTVQEYKELIDRFGGEEYQERLDSIKDIFRKKTLDESIQEVKELDKERRSKG